MKVVVSTNHPSRFDIPTGAHHHIPYLFHGVGLYADSILYRLDGTLSTADCLICRCCMRLLLYEYDGDKSLGMKEERFECVSHLP